MLETELRKRLLILPKEFGKGKEGLAEWIVNKPSRSWKAPCPKGGGRKFGVGDHKAPLLRHIWGSVYEANPVRSGRRSGIRGKFRLREEKKGVVKELGRIDM